MASLVLPTIVDAARKPLPLHEIVLPGIDEAYAIFRCDHVIKMVLGRPSDTRAEAMRPWSSLVSAAT
jgi:hypothetical protein